MPSSGSACVFAALTAWQGWIVQASSGNSVDVTGLFQSSVRVAPESLWASMPPIRVDNLDHSTLATKFITLLQGHRFHRSFMLINNLTSATLDLHSSTKNALVHLKTGVNKSGLAEQEAAQQVAAAFAEEMQAVEYYMNTTESKLEDYLNSLPSEDSMWVRSVAAPVVQHMKQLLAPIQGKTDFMLSVSDTHSVCLMAKAVLDDLQSVDKIITEYAIPTFNKTTGLIPTLQLQVSKGRMNMLKRFADQGYSILDKLRSVAQLPNSTLAPLLIEHLQCGGSGSSGSSSSSHSESQSQSQSQTPSQTESQDAAAGEATATVAPQTAQTEEVPPPAAVTEELPAETQPVAAEPLDQPRPQSANVPAVAAALQPDAPQEVVAPNLQSQSQSQPQPQPQLVEQRLTPQESASSGLALPTCAALVLTLALV